MELVGVEKIRVARETLHGVVRCTPLKHFRVCSGTEPGDPGTGSLHRPYCRAGRRRLPSDALSWRFSPERAWP